MQSPAASLCAIPQLNSSNLPNVTSISTNANTKPVLLHVSEPIIYYDTALSILLRHPLREVVTKDLMQCAIRSVNTTHHHFSSPDTNTYSMFPKRKSALKRSRFCVCMLWSLRLAALLTSSCFDVGPPSIALLQVLVVTYDFSPHARYYLQLTWISAVCSLLPP